MRTHFKYFFLGAVVFVFNSSAFADCAQYLKKDFPYQNQQVIDQKVTIADVQLSGMFVIEVLRKKCELEAIHAKMIGANWKSLCPSIKPRNKSHCVRQITDELTFTTATEIAPWATTIIVAADFDKREGKGNLQVSILQMADNILLALENVDLNNFYLSRVETTVEAEASELSILKHSESDILDKSKSKLLQMISRSISEVENSSRATSSQGATKGWVQRMTRSLKIRLAKIKTKNLKHL